MNNLNDTDRIGTFLRSLENDLPEYLQKIEDEALADFVPIIRKESQSTLKTLVAALRPKKVLEIGTAVGFSTLLIRDTLLEIGLPSDITTIEYFEPRIAPAKENFKRAGVKNTDQDRIDFIFGDALKILPELTDKYDFIFLDAAKAQYINMLPYIRELLNSGGMILTDNILQDGEILESRYLITQRDRTIHARMREFLYAIKHDEELITTIIPVGDGMSISVKK